MHIYTIFSVLFIRRLLFLLKLKFIRIEFTPPLECMLSICECLDFILSPTTKESNTNLFLDLVCLHSYISRYVNHYQMVTSLKSNSLNFSTLHFLNLFRLPSVVQFSTQMLEQLQTSVVLSLRIRLVYSSFCVDLIT